PYKGSHPVHTDRIRQNQGYIAIDPAVELMLTRPRRKLCIPFIVHTDKQFIDTLSAYSGQINDKRGVSSSVLPDRHLIQKDFCTLEHTVKLQKQPFFKIFCGKLQFSSVASVSHIKFVFHKIRNSERMRQSDIWPLFPVAGLIRFAESVDKFPA